MSDQQEMRELRKRALLAESELQRLELRGDLIQLHDRFEWLHKVRELPKRTGGWTLLAAGLAGSGLAVGAWRQRRWIGRAARVATAARPVIGTLRKILQARRSTTR